MAETITKFSSQLIVDVASRITTARGRYSGAEAFNSVLTLTHGTGNNQINKYWGDDRAIAAGANDDLDLAGVLTDARGGTITFTTIKGIYVVNNSALIATKIIVANTGSTWLASPWAMTIGKGGKVCWEDPTSGDNVVGASGDVLRITNADGVNAAAYAIVIVGLV